MNASTTLRAMTPAEFAAWREAAIPGYAADKVASGQWAAPDALALSAKEYDELLPQGLATPDQHFYAIVDAQGAPVGTLWFAVKTKFGAPIAYVFDVRIDAALRRRGHARATFVALEGEVRRLGLRGVALQVFGHNAAARALYAGLGYEPTNISLYKAVG
ncbi:MAG TPA: GNAT family N-acetyltransferase [Burkholderiaceae bacterium]|nr:GNAT family N-acetyltransferase [Burkholderiaceae bacterium]